MYIKWQYKWFGNKFLFFFNSPSELAFWITYPYLADYLLKLEISETHVKKMDVLSVDNNYRS
jgi:hypothetical protein